MSNRNQLKTAILCAVIIILAGLVFIEYIEIDLLQSNNSYLDRQVASMNEEIENYRKPNLKGMNCIFVGANFTGIVYNAGYSTAHNAKLAIMGGDWSYDIQLGDIEPFEGLFFSEDLPFPNEPKYQLFLTDLQWAP